MDSVLLAGIGRHKTMLFHDPPDLAPGDRDATGSSHDKDNRTPEEQELLRLRKENQQLRMENDVLKQAALIFARK